MCTFYDPYSIRSVSVSTPIEGHIFFQRGWITCLKANAKNRMGGYTGLQSTAYLIHQGEVINVQENSDLCEESQVIYYPWP